MFKLLGSYYTYWSYYTYCSDFFRYFTIISTVQSQKMWIVLFIFIVVSYAIDIVSDDYDVTHSEDALSRVAWIANRSYRARPEFVFINIFIANPPPHSHQLPSDSNRLGYLTLYLLEAAFNKESFSLLQTVLPSSCDLNNSLWREAMSKLLHL